MTPEEWESLVSSPGWPALKRYLMDYRSRVMEMIASGRMRADDWGMQDAIARCQNLKDLAEMDWATIEKFYAPPELGQHE